MMLLIKIYNLVMNESRMKNDKHKILDIDLNT